MTRKGRNDKSQDSEQQAKRAKLTYSTMLKKGESLDSSGFSAEDFNFCVHDRPSSQVEGEGGGRAPNWGKKKKKTNIDELAEWKGS